jgi:hypothetical protein
MTDSGTVPRGKGEKNRVDRSEIEPETVCLQTVGGRWPIFGWVLPDRVPFGE